MRTASIARSAVIAALLPLSSAAAQDEPDLSEAVEVHDDFTLHFSQIDVIVPRDSLDMLAGVTDQFLGGRKILSEVRLKAPIALARLEAMAREKGSSAFSFRCGRVSLYDVRSTPIVLGEDCEMVER